MGNRNLKIKKILHPTFLLFFLWFVISKDLISFFVFSFVLLSHEFGHYFVAKKLGYKLDSFCIAPYGVSLNYKESVFDSFDEIMIAFAGPFVNIITSLIFVSIWWAFPVMYGYTNQIVSSSLLLGLFNLLPCYPLDGGRIVCGVLGGVMQREKAVKIICRLNYVFSGIFLLLFIYSFFVNFNPTFALFSVFLILGSIENKNDAKYTPIYLLKKKVKSYSKPVFKFITDEQNLSSIVKHIESNKYTIFVLKTKKDRTIFLNEDILMKISLSYPLNTKLCEIFKQEKG